MTNDFFFQVFAKKSVKNINNIFEEEKKFDSGTQFFLWKIVPNWVYFENFILKF